LRIFVPGVHELPKGGSRTFQFVRDGRTLEGFVLFTGQKLVAYANECPHWHVDLDLGMGRFWDHASGRIVCRNHAALFHPDTGFCERGPCVGHSLEAFEVISAEGDGVWIDVPDVAP
jgi:nitrite reductase/ring-hydroxylating ferredoxin subunit